MMECPKRMEGRCQYEEDDCVHALLHEKIHECRFVVDDPDKEFTDIRKCPDCVKAPEFIQEEEMAL